MSQSRSMSLIESITNVAVGFAVALATQVLAFPVVGIQASLGQNLWLGSIFTMVSLFRSYLLRRLFNRMRTAT